MKKFSFLDENEIFFNKLKNLIEETYNINKQVPVTLLAHSMGGPMSLIFLQRQSQKWKDKYINCLITLSAVWGGSVKALKVFAIGIKYYHILYKIYIIYYIKYYYILYIYKILSIYYIIIL